MWRRLKPNMPSFRRIDNLFIVRQLEPDKKDEKMHKNQRLFDFCWRLLHIQPGDYGASDYGTKPWNPATFRLFQNPATFANMPATFQRLWQIPGKIPEFPEKSAENRNFWKKMGQNPEKWDIFPNFRGNRGGFYPSFMARLGAAWGPLPFLGYRYTGWKKAPQTAARSRRQGKKNRGNYPPVSSVLNGIISKSPKSERHT